MEILSEPFSLCPVLFSSSPHILLSLFCAFTFPSQDRHTPLFSSSPSPPVTGDWIQRLMQSVQAPATLLWDYTLVTTSQVSVQMPERASKPRCQWNIKFSFSQTGLVIFIIKLMFFIVYFYRWLIISTNTWLLESLGHMWLPLTYFRNKLMSQTPKLLLCRIWGHIPQSQVHCSVSLLVFGCVLFSPILSYQLFPWCY